jgi:hypothetical protein
MSGWERTHRRYRLAYAVAEDVARRGPGALSDWASQIDAEYGDVGQFLLDVQRRWHNAVDARLDLLLEERPDDVESAAAGVMASLAESDGDLRAVLDAFAGHPALADGATRHRLHVLATTGVDEAMVGAPMGGRGGGGAAARGARGGGGWGQGGAAPGGR